MAWKEWKFGILKSVEGGQMPSQLRMASLVCFGASIIKRDELDYRFVHRGSGICGSEPELEIRWFMNKDFRLATLRDWIAQNPKKVIDFTRYDLEAQESVDPEPGKPIRNWSLMNRLNQKGIRPQDVPIKIGKLSPNE